MVHRRPQRRRCLPEPLLTQTIAAASPEEIRPLWSRAERLRRETKDALIVRILRLESTVKQQKAAEKLPTRRDRPAQREQSFFKMTGNQGAKLKNPTGWFPAGQEVVRASGVLSDGAFRLYMHLCLTADRSTGRLQVRHADLAKGLRRSRRSVVTYLEELRTLNVCAIRSPVNQHAVGEIEICDAFWP